MIILTLRRTTFTDKDCRGVLSWDGTGQWFTLEDVDRGLHQFMLRQAIEQIKKQDETAIPYGFYEVTIDKSVRFGRFMPHVLNVPGFEGIRIHAGNTAVDTSGCILLGKLLQADGLANSRTAFEEFEKRLAEALTDHRVFLSVTK